MRLLYKLGNRVRIRGYQSGIWAAMGIHAIRSIGFSISFTYLPLYLYQQRNISMTIAGSVILVSGILSGICQNAGGVLADRFGHRKMFIIFQVSEVILFALLAVQIGLNAFVWSIFLTTFLIMVMGGMSAPAISAIVADVSQKNRMTESYGLVAIGENLGWAIGPLTGGYLQSYFSFAWVFGIGAVVTSLSLISIPYLPKDTIVKSTEVLSVKTLKAFLSDSRLIIFCVLCMLFYLEMAQWGSTLSVFTIDRVGFLPEKYGLLMTISGILIITFQYPISRRIEWLGSSKALFLGSLLYGIGFLSFSWVESFTPAVGSIIILVIGEMLFVPTAYAVIGRISKPEDRAKNMGLIGLCATIGSSFGPLLGGFLLDKFLTRPLCVWGPVSLPAFVAAFAFIFWRGYLQTETIISSIPDKKRKDGINTPS